MAAEGSGIPIFLKNALAVLIDRFIASGKPSPRHMVGVAAVRRKGAGDNGVAGERESSRHDALCLLGGSDVQRGGD